MHWDIKVAKLSSKEKALDIFNMFQKMRQIILVELLDRNESKPLAIDVPHTSMLTTKPLSYLSIGTDIQKANSKIHLGYQAANNDFLTQPLSGQEVSRFIVGRTSLSIDQNDIDINELTLLDLAHLNSTPIGKPIDRLSWGIKIGYEKQNPFCESCGSFNLNLKGGIAQRFKPHFIAFSLNGMRLQSDAFKSSSFYEVISENGFIYNLSEDLRMSSALLFSVDPKDGHNRAYTETSFRKDLTNNKDLNLTLTNDGQNTKALVQLRFLFN